MIPMKSFFGLLLICITFSATAQPNKDFDVRWSNGLKIVSADKDFKLKFGGRLMYDMTFFDQSDSLSATFGELKSGSEFRRARLFGSGQIYNNIHFKLQVDFAGGVTVLKDAFIQMSDIPWIGNLRVGHLKEPFRLEALTSSKYITFMERSQHMPFVPARNSGILAYNALLHNRIGWQLGVFRNGEKISGDDKDAGNAYNITGRITALLINNQEKHHLLHLGLAYSLRSTRDGNYNLSFRPASHLAPKYISSTFSAVEHSNIIDFEAALVMDAFSVQAEFLQAKTDFGVSSINSSAFYGQISYFLTGEYRPYKNSYEGFGRIKPIKNYDAKGNGGIGAWELALRYEQVDLTQTSGSQMRDITFGVNWYVNPATRLMLNYVLATIAKQNFIDDQQAGILEMRFQVDF